MILPYEERGIGLWGCGMALVNCRLRETGTAAEVHPIRNEGPRQNEADEWLFWTRIERRKTEPWEEEGLDLEIRDQLKDRLGAPADMKWSTKVIRL